MPARLRPIALLAAAAIALGTAVVGVALPASAGVGDTPCVPHAPGRSGHIGGIVHQVKHVGNGRPCPPTYHPIGKNSYYYPGTTPPLLYNGGPVMATTGSITVTPIYWGPSGYGFPSAYQSVLNTFLANVAADSGKPTNVFSPLAQWTSGSGRGHYTFATGAAVADTTPFPATGACTPDAGAIYPDNSGFTACVTDPQVQAEIASVIQAHGMPTDLNHIYPLFLPKNVESCFGSLNASQGGQCTKNAYCAYHSWEGNTSAPLVDALIPYAIPVGCTTTVQSPNGNADADIVTSPLSHELNEAASDPLLNAWYDSSGYENGDECAYIFGATSGTSGAQYNQTINGAHYFLQEEFSNEDYAMNSTAGCIQHEESPVASFSVTPVSPGVGQSATFTSASTDGDHSSGITAYAWTFGDGSTSSTGPTTTHAYAAAGTFTATLKVTDVDGYQGTVSHTVTVGSSTPPTVTSRTPAANATGVALGTATTPTLVKAKFNQQVTGVSGSSFTLKLGTTAVAATVAYNATTFTATFKPSGALIADSHYTAALTSAIKSSSGTALTAQSWTFTTGPKPTVTSRTPAAGATGVHIGSASLPTLVKATFSETVTGVSGSSFTLKAGTTAVAGTVTYSSGTATFTPSGALKPNTVYTVALSSAIKDLAGNPLTAVKWTFTTGAS